MYQIDSRVRYSEVDSEQRLKLAALLDYLQDCCTFQSEELGVGVDYLAKEQVAWVLSSWEIEIVRYPQMAERIKVGTWPSYFKGFYGHRNFVIEDEKGEVLVAANSVWVFMDLARMRPTKVSEKMLATYQALMEDALEGNWSERKIEVPKVRSEMEPVQVAKYFIDTNHHMNNGKYVLVAQEYLPEGFEVGRLRVEYKKAAVLGDVLYPSVAVAENEVTVVLADADGSIYAVVCFIRK